MIFNRTNETINAIWNTTAGGDSSPAVSGDSTGTYWPTEPAYAVFDNDFTSSYTNHGNCNYTWASMTCGENTGLYLTLDSGPLTLVAFYFVTNLSDQNRDPLTITMEGSDLHGSVLTRGSSWTLIYNGSTGITDGLEGATMGTIQILTNSPMQFSSYRLLVTSTLGYDTCVSYAEFVIIGY